MRVLLVLCCCWPALAFPIIRILTCHCNHPQFIELQHKTLRHFMKDPYELIIFNDALDERNATAIQETCERLQIQCVRYQQEWHEILPQSIELNTRVLGWVNDPAIRPYFSVSNPPNQHGSIRHQHVLAYALENYGYPHDDIVVILDGDAFPIRPLDLRSMLSSYDMIGTLPGTHNLHEPPWPPGSPAYLWVPFIAINMPKIAEKRDCHFSSDVIHGLLCETGAHSFHYLAHHPELPYKTYQVNSTPYIVKMIERGASRDFIKERFGLLDREFEFVRRLPPNVCVQFLIENNILHFSAGSFSLQGEKITVVTDFVNTICGR